MSSPEIQPDFLEDGTKKLSLEDEENTASCEGSPVKETGHITGAFIG